MKIVSKMYLSARNFPFHSGGHLESRVLIREDFRSGIRLGGGQRSPTALVSNEVSQLRTVTSKFI